MRNDTDRTLAELERALSDANARIAALKRTQADLRELVDRAPAAMFLRDQNGRTRVVNRAYERRYGVSREAVEGKTLAQIFPPAQAERYARHDSAVIDRGSLVEEEIDVEVDGERRVFVSSKFPIWRGGGTSPSIGGIEYDVTEQRRAGEALKHSEQRFRHLVEGLKDNVFFTTVDSAGEITYVSPSVENVLGYTPEECLIHWSAFVSDSLTRETVERVTESLSRGELPAPYEAVVLHKDGSNRVLEVIETPVWDKDGEVIGSEGIFHDITRRKQAEHALRESQELLRTMIDHIPARIFLRDRAGRFLMVNKRYEIDCEVRDEEIRGRTLVEVLDRNQAERFGREDRKVIETGLTHEKEKAVEVGGQPRTLSSILFPVRDLEGEVVSIGGIQIDITERKQAEQELRDSERRLIQILDSSPSGVVITSLRTQEVLFGNDRFREMFGLGDQPLNGIDWSQTYVHPEERAGLMAQFRRAGVLRDVERERRRPDGSTFWALVTFLKMDYAGEPARLSWYYDITGRKAAETAVLAAKEEAERALADLRHAQDQLVQAEKMASLGQLTAGVAHEIKNPLNFINNFAETSIELISELEEILAGGLAAPTPEVREEAAELIDTLAGDLRTITRHGKRADQIIRSMLLHARGEIADRAATPLNALVEEAMKLAYHGERARDKSFQTALEPTLDASLGDADVIPQELTRVLVNLFSNAFHAVGLRLRQAGDPAYRPRVEVSTRDLGDSVEIRVRDNGCGMSPDVRAHVFEPFFTTKPTGQGTGLGLSMSYDIVVQQHGGSIEIRSEPDRFTEVMIVLPRHAEGERRGPASGSSP